VVTHRDRVHVIPDIKKKTTIIQASACCTTWPGSIPGLAPQYNKDIGVGLNDCDSRYKLYRYVSIEKYKKFKKSGIEPPNLFFKKKIIQYL
jgi:hypothetical protein